MVNIAVCEREGKWGALDSQSMYALKFNYNGFGICDIGGGGGE